MTAFVVAPYVDRVEILSDGAIYSPGGILVGTANKVITSGVVPMAIIGSGATAEIAALSEAILSAAAKTRSVDATLKILAGALSEIGKAPNFDTGLRIAIAGISESEGPVAYVLSTFEDASSSLAALELVRMRRVFAQGAAPTGEDLVAYGPVSIIDGLERDAVFFLESMRKQKMTNPADPDREPFYSVGSHIDLTIIRADGYEQRMLHAWPDQVGEKIDPFSEVCTTHDDGTTFDDGTEYVNG